MPMQSQAQRAYLHIHEPAVAAEFEAATPPGAKLPYKVGHGKRRHAKGHSRRPSPRRKRV